MNFLNTIMSDMQNNSNRAFCNSASDIFNAYFQIVHDINRKNNNDEGIRKRELVREDIILLFSEFLDD